MKNWIRSCVKQRIPAAFVKDEGGATAIEYAMIASLISVAIASTIPGIGAKVSAMFSTLSNLL